MFELIILVIVIGFGLYVRPNTTKSILVTTVSTGRNIVKTGYLEAKAIKIENESSDISFIRGETAIKDGALRAKAIDEDTGMKGRRQTTSNRINSILNPTDTTTQSETQAVEVIETTTESTEQTQAS